MIVYVLFVHNKNLLQREKFVLFSYKILNFKKHTKKTF